MAFGVEGIGGGSSAIVHPPFELPILQKRAKINTFIDTIAIAPMNSKKAPIAADLSKTNNLHVLFGQRYEHAKEECF